MVWTDHFRQELLAQMNRAFKGGLIDVLINSRDLHRSFGGYPGSLHGMPSCCDAMQAEMKPGDTLVVERANDTGMTVRYRLPRANKGDLSDVRDNGFGRLAGRAIVYAQIETRFLRFDTGQYQRPAAFGAGRPKIIDELKFERVYHSRDQSALLR